MRTLLLDDEAFVLKALTRVLAAHGVHDVTGCERAWEALDMLAEQPGAFDMVMLDLNMPEMDGVEFLRHLTRIRFRGAVVLVSGTDRRILDTAVKLAESHGLEVLGALTKPVDRQALAGILARRGVHPPALPPRSAPRSYGPDEVRRAIAEGELANFYQPKVDLAHATVVGVETLVRWHHPTDGTVFPDQFIPVAEQHGLVDELTRVVLTRAIADGVRWAEAGLALHVAVNVSMDNLSSLALPDLLQQEAKRLGFPATAIILEVTESRLAQDHHAPRDVLTRLRLKGVGLSIDDFGTGYSSLAQLRDYPFDELKIDRGFVHGAWRDASLRSIFEASQGLARQLGMRVVAEGVEDSDDWRFVQESGCDMAQGYFIARPMPVQDLLGWATNWEGRRAVLEAASPPPRCVLYPAS